MIAAGPLDRRLQILRAPVVDDGYQTRLGEFAVIGTIWGARRDVSDGERQRSGMIGAEITARFQVRSSVFSRAITPKDRLREGGREFDITGIKEIGRQDGLEISARARADTDLLA